MTKKQTDLKVSDLKPAEYNPRYISDEKLEMLEKSMKVYGDLSGIVFNKKTGNLIGGHQRLKNFDASKIVHIEPVTDKTGTVGLGYIETPSGRFQVRLVEWDLTTEKAANIAANKQGGQWDFDKLKDLLTELDHENYDMDLTGFDGEELENLLNDSFLDKYADTASIDEIEEDNVNLEPPKEPITKEGDLYELNRHRLLCGDSTSLKNIETLLINEKADLILTDPPYNHASDNDGVARNVSKAHKDLMESEWDKDFLFENIEASLEFTRAKNSSMYIFTSWHLAGDIWEYMKRLSNHYSYLVWWKPNPMPSLMKRHWTWSTELICYATYGKHIFNFKDGEHNYNLLKFTKKSDGTHPTQKPLDLLGHIIIHSSNYNSLVVDLFLGSGSTLIASEQLDRKCYGLELMPKYCDVIVRRWVTHMRENDKEFTVTKNGKKLTLDQIAKYLG